MRIGVVIPAFNLGLLLADAIRSVLMQSHADLALVVVDDGSTDDTLGVARAVIDPRLAVLSQPNMGVSVARNRGLAALPAVDAVLFLDGDDMLAPDALKRLAAALKAMPGAVAAVGPAQSGNCRPRPTPYGDMLAALLVGNRYVNGGQILIRRTAVAAAGTFHPGLRFGEDWEYWTRIACLGPFTATGGNAPVLQVRTRAEGAYRRQATDHLAFTACLTAIYANPMVRARISVRHVAALKQAAEAESAWIIGREFLRQGQRRDGLRWLVRSVAAVPRVKRVGLLALACLPPHWPCAWRGPFHEYPLTEPHVACRLATRNQHV